MKKTIATWLIMLIIVLPIQVAASLSEVHVSNKDMVENYRAQTNDKIIVTAKAELPGDEDIQSSQVLIGEEEFTSCESLALPDTGFFCKYEGDIDFSAGS